MNVQIKVLEPGQKEERVLLELDAMPTERFGFSQEATEHPIEEGAEIVDHMRRKPDTLSFDAIVTSTPIMRGEDVTAQGLESGPGKSPRIAAARDALLSLEGRTCTILTEFQKYESMACLSLDFSRTATNSDTLSFSATFKKIRTVQTATVRLETKAFHGNKGRKLGHKPAPKAPEPVDRRSAAKKLVDAGKEATTALKGYFIKSH